MHSERLVLKPSCQSFCVMPVKKQQHLLFNFLSFRFFKNSRGGNILVFGNPRVLTSLLALPYVVFTEPVFLRRRLYFVKFKEHVVGAFALREKPEALFITSLAVAPEFRRLGIATYILDYVKNLASGLGKSWMDLNVLKTNTPAQRLYFKYGFVKSEEKKFSLILRSEVTASGVFGH